MYLFVLCGGVMSVYHVHAWNTQRPEEGVRPFGSRVTKSHKPPCGYWELRLGLLGKHLNSFNC